MPVLTETRILKGLPVQKEIKANLTAEVALLKDKPHLVIGQVGKREDSERYVTQKLKTSDEVGIDAERRRFCINVSESYVIGWIRDMNADPRVNGLIIQLPLSEKLRKEPIIDAIDPRKDVDGLTDSNFGRLAKGDSTGLVPATSKGIMELLKYYDFPVAGKTVAVVGRSILVGRPMMQLLLNADATPVPGHSKTNSEDDPEKLKRLTRQADVVIAAIGCPEYFGAEYFDPDRKQVVIDVGTNDPLEPKGKLRGDVKFDEVKNVVRAITPVPGGVGPLTVIMLLDNTMTAYKEQSGKRLNIKIKQERAA